MLFESHFYRFRKKIDWLTEMQAKTLLKYNKMESFFLLRVFDEF